MSLSFACSQSRLGKVRPNVDAFVANSIPRKIPLASFFPALGSRNGVIFLGFLKNAADEERIISIDGTSLRFHEFFPFRAGSVVGAERLRLRHSGRAPPTVDEMESFGIADQNITVINTLMETSSYDSLLISNFTVLIAGNVVVSVVSRCSAPPGTVIRVFLGEDLVYYYTYPSSTADHSLYRMDYLDPSSPFAVVYRTSRCSVTVVSSVCEKNRNNDCTFSLEKNAWHGTGTSWYSTDKIPADSSQRIASSQFKGLDFAHMYVSTEYPGYIIYESRTAVAIAGSPDVNIKQVPIVFYIPLESSKGGAERKRKHLLLILSLNYHTGKVSLRSVVDAEDVISGPQKLEFDGYCKARGLKSSFPSTAYFCRDLLCEDDPSYIAKESFCSVLSNFSLTRNTESWYAEIEHPHLPLVVYNDEVHEILALPQL